MKKNKIFSMLVVAAIIACTLFLSDGIVYLIAAFMALIVSGIIHLSRKRVMKVTRWAKANPKKAQVFITSLQIALMALGTFAGYSLKKLGYELSTTTIYVFSMIMTVSFLSVPFLPKRREIAIPRVVNRRRLAYIGIALSSFVLLVVFGNRLERDYPQSQLAYTVRDIDNAIFREDAILAKLYNEASESIYTLTYGQYLYDGSANNAMYTAYTIYDKETIAPSSLSKKEIKEKRLAEKKVRRFEKKKQKMMNLIAKKRLALVAAAGAGAVLLIVLLVITTCAGVCLLIAAFSGEGIGYGILGAVIAGASIFGIVKISQNNKREPKTEP